MYGNSNFLCSCSLFKYLSKSDINFVSFPVCLQFAIMKRGDWQIVNR